MSGLSIDLGCGFNKRPGTVGVDRLAGPGVDHVCDFSTQPLPLPDGSVGSLFSSHSIEHVADTQRLLREITRVCAHGATIELWHPFSGHRNAFLLDHKAFLNEENYVHLSSHAPAYWAGELGGWWRIHELVFTIDGAVLAELEGAGIDADFAVKYLSNVVTELGVFGTIDKQGTPPAQAPAPRRVYAVSRNEADRRLLVPPPPAVRQGLGERLRRRLLGS